MVRTVKRLPEARRLQLDVFKSVKGTPWNPQTAVQPGRPRKVQPAPAVGAPVSDQADPIAEAEKVNGAW